jgi:hypothetical protein
MLTLAIVITQPVLHHHRLRRLRQRMPLVITKARQGPLAVSVNVKCPWQLVLPATGLPFRSVRLPFSISQAHIPFIQHRIQSILTYNNSSRHATTLENVIPRFFSFEIAFVFYSSRRVNSSLSPLLVRAFFARSTSVSLPRVFSNRSFTFFFFVSCPIFTSSFRLCLCHLLRSIHTNTYINVKPKSKKEACEPVFFR